MQTTLLLKTDKKLRDEAKIVAEELGIPLTTVINALLRQFVREKKFSISIEPSPTKDKIALWKSISAEMDTERDHLKSFSNTDDLLKYLKI